LVTVACFIPGQAKDSSAPPHNTFSRPVRHNRGRLLIMVAVAAMTSHFLFNLVLAGWLTV